MASDSRGTTAVSLLITPTVLVAVQVRSSAQGVEVTARGSVGTPMGAVEGAFVQSPVRLAKAIRTLWHSLNLRSRSVTVTLSSASYALRTLRLPDAPPREQRALVRGELEQIAALPIGSGGFDFLWLSSAVGGSAPAEVMAYYASDSVVDSVRDALHRAGLKMEGIEPFSLGLMRAYLAGQSTRQTVALLYPAEKHTDFCFHDGTKVRHIRRIPAGWGDIAQDLAAKSVRSPLADHEAPGLQEESYAARWSSSGEHAEGAEKPAPPMWESPTASLHRAMEIESTGKGGFLAAEVIRSLAFFAREHSEEVRPAAIAIVGPARVAYHIEQALTPVQSLPVVVTEPLAYFDPPRAITAPLADSDPSEYAAVIGAAMGRLGLENGLPVLDVSLQEEAARTRRRAPVALLAGMAGSSLWMILATVAAIALSFLEASALTESRKLTEGIAQTRREQAPALWYQEKYNAARTAQTKVQIPAASVLGRVAASASGGISLTQLNVSHEGKVTISGKAANIIDVQNFALAIGQGRSVHTPVIQAMHQEPAGGLTFTILGTFPRLTPPDKTDKITRKD